MTQNPVSVPTISVRFPGIPLLPDLIRKFRGDVIARAPTPDDRLHNHAPDGRSLLRYPLVQYRVWQGKATLFGIGEGVPLVQAFLTTLQNTPYAVEPAQTDIGLTERPQRYSIGQWWALNSENLQRWEQTTALRDRIVLLESILVNQLLAICTAVGYQVPERGLQVEIQELMVEPPRQISTQTKPVQVMLFSVVYSTNLRLPVGIGVGKGVSKGLGVQMPVSPHWHLHLRRQSRTHTNRSTNENA